MFDIKNVKFVVCALVLGTTFGLGVAKASAFDGVLSKTPLTTENYCHLQFPAIHQRTLGTDHPQLKSPNSGDIIDYYGSCNHNPLGQDEVQSQEQEQLVRGQRNMG